jgi:sugar/nucleoside kinase (ribokinase family)
VLRALKREHVDCTFCQRIPGLATALSTIFMNSRGDRPRKFLDAKHLVDTTCGKKFRADRLTKRPGFDRIRR